jgi:cytochrome c oxidase cbb3-type subunit I/II
MSNEEQFRYDDGIVRLFSYATLIWGAVAFLLGVTIALQMAFWPANMEVPWLTFGRLRPLHTNAAIFAFGGNAIFAGVYYSIQRLLKARLFSDGLSKFHFWGWQLIIVCAALTIPFGFTSGKEYAELEWPIDIAITVVWVVFAVNFFGTIIRRRERHIYVAIWFYIATITTVAVLHIFNSLALPLSFLKSYSVYSGVQDALVQWWYGHNAVAFFLTTPFLGLMYYFIPKASGKPVYSYRLSIIHFWALVFIYIWAGPHHLLYTALPEWAQTLGMTFSLMLWAPSWGGMINGLLTLRGAWDKVAKDPVLKFMVAAVTFYGMSTFEGPLMSIKAVNSLSHYTDWTVGHVHSGTLGWNGFLTFGMLYYLVPKLWKTELYSHRLATWHFWMGIAGIILYITSMWASGITQGLMWRAIDESGRLAYPEFAETVTRIVPLYWVRFLGGLSFFSGFLLMLYNMFKTIQSSKSSLEDESVSAVSYRNSESHLGTGHRKLEGLPMTFTVLAVLAILVGSLVELVPTIFSKKKLDGDYLVQPYTSLQLAGRDIYIREGCYNCHSQMIRRMVSEKLRYGQPSLAAESMYDHPFQWGSKRTGPDLARVGGKYSHLWHFRHMLNPRDVVVQSIMPSYPWIIEDNTDFASLKDKLALMKKLGVPYTDAQIQNAVEDARAEAKKIASELEAEGGPGAMEDKEIIALISYLQVLGTHTLGFDWVEQFGEGADDDEDDEDEDEDEEEGGEQ